MYQLTDLVTAIHNEKLQVAGRTQAYAPRRAGTRSSMARRLASVFVLPRRRPAVAY